MPSLTTTFYIVTCSLNLRFPSEDQLATQPEEHLFLHLHVVFPVQFSSGNGGVQTSHICSVLTFS